MTAMTDLSTPRLLLRPVDVAQAQRIVARRPDASDRWASDFPFEGDVVGARMHLRATQESGEQQPFGLYLIVRAADGLAVGACGFKGRPVDGVAEIGYGLVPSARGQGYAAEAATALVDLARRQGLSRVLADTDPEDVASRRTLERAGFTQVGADAGLCSYEPRL